MKSGEDIKGVLVRSFVFSDSKDESGKRGCPGLGVLDLMGFRAKAWDCRLMDMDGVRVEEEKVGPWKEVLNGEQKREMGIPFLVLGFGGGG